MKKLIRFVLVVIVASLLYVCYFRISSSKAYEEGLINQHILSGDNLSLSIEPIGGLGNHNFIETVVVPVSKGEKFKLQLDGGYLVSFFGLYNIAGWHDYKPFVTSDDSKLNTFIIDTTKDFRFSSEIGYKYLLRNTVFDKGGSLEAIVMQIVTSGSSNLKVSKNIVE